MVRNFIIVLFVLMGFGVSGCKTLPPKVIYKYVEKSVYCAPTQMPVFPDFNYDKPLNDPENIETLLEMLNLYKKFTDDLRTEIICYEDQTLESSDKIKDLRDTKKKIDEYIGFLEKNIGGKVV
jgi:hypothetical protein